MICVSSIVENIQLQSWTWKVGVDGRITSPRNGPQDSVLVKVKAWVTSPGPSTIRGAVLPIHYWLKKHTYIKCREIQPDTCYNQGWAFHNLSCEFCKETKGRMKTPKRMFYRKSSNPKIYIADLCHYKRYFGHEFLKKIHNMIFRKWGAGVKGRLEFFWKLRYIHFWQLLTGFALSHTDSAFQEKNWNCPYWSV